MPATMRMTVTAGTITDVVIPSNGPLTGFESTLPTIAVFLRAMAKAALAHRFVTPLVRHESALGVMHLLPVPDEIASAWKQAKVRRLVGSINGHPVKRALQNHADGGSFIMVGKPLIEECGLSLKALAKVELRPDPRPDDLDLPEEWLAALAQDDEARARWETFTIGMQRSLAYYISSAKQEATRIKRSLELAAKIRNRELHSDRKAKAGGKTNPASPAPAAAAWEANVDHDPDAPKARSRASRPTFYERPR